MADKLVQLPSSSSLYSRFTLKREFFRLRCEKGWLQDRKTALGAQPFLAKPFLKMPELRSPAPLPKADSSNQNDRSNNDIHHFGVHPNHFGYFPPRLTERRPDRD